MTSAQSRLMPLGSLLALLILAALVVQLLRPSPQVPVTEAAGAGYWSTGINTAGLPILKDANGAEVRITGVNWFGFESANHVPHGLWARGYKAMMNQMKNLGYNSIRLPFSTQMLRSTTTSGLNTYENPDLVGLTPIMVMDKIVDYAGQIGLRIILDRHRVNDYVQTALWYTTAARTTSTTDRTCEAPHPKADHNPPAGTPCYNEDDWIADWKMLAQRYANKTQVVGADLHNEPHSDDDTSRDSCWGCGNLDTDWRLAAERAGNAILSVNPGWLIFVQGVGCWGRDASGNVIADVPTGAQAWPSLHCTWWGGNLRGVAEYPVRLSLSNKLVYSVHEYPRTVHAHKWFDASTYPNNLDCLWEHYWAYIITRKHCDGGPNGGDEAFSGPETRVDVAATVQKVPIWVGEYGSKMIDASDISWIDKLVPYLKANALNWSYWSWNPNSGDTGGLVNDDWIVHNTFKDRKVAGCQGEYLVAVDPVGPALTRTPAPECATVTRTNTPPSATATRTRTPGLATATPLTTSYEIVNRNSGKCMDVAGWSTADGGNVQQWACSGGNNQRWRVEDLGNGYSRLVNIHSGKALDVNGCGTTDGTNIQQWTWLNNNCQQWRVLTTTAPYVRLENRNSGKVVDVVGCGTTDGTNIQQWTWLNNNCQQWQLRP